MQQCSRGQLESLQRWLWNLKQTPLFTFFGVKMFRSSGDSETWSNDQTPSLPFFLSSSVASFSVAFALPFGCRRCCECPLLAVWKSWSCSFLVVLPSGGNGSA